MKHLRVRAVTMLFVLMFFLCNSLAAQLQVNIYQPVVPVLTLKKENPILRIEIIKSQYTDCVINKISFSLKQTPNSAILEQLSLFEANLPRELSISHALNSKQLLSSTRNIKKTVSFDAPIILKKDTTVLWLSARLNENIDLNGNIHIACKEIKTSCGKADIKMENQSQPMRLGVALRQMHQDKVHTSRIPGLATSKKGTLMAIYDARRDNSRDLQGDMDIALNRSFDGGRTWQPMQVVLDMKEWGGLPEKYNGVSDACILIDENSDDIYIAGLWMHGVLDGATGKWREGMTKDSTRWIHQWVQKGSQPGLGVKETSQFLIAKSSDDGATWSEPINITSQTKRPEWWLYAPAPGHGITLKDGTLVFPTQGRDAKGLPFSNITWSKDQGKTWHTSNPAYHDTTECMAVELSDGSVMLNMRDNRNRNNSEVNGRRVCTTTDLGENWSEHPTSRKALVEPTCMASIHKHTYEVKGEKKEVLFFSNPESYKNRHRMTVKVSFDDGMTWPDEYKILLDEGMGFGYSCITSIDSDHIGILYEGSMAQMVFQKINVKEILKK